MVLTDRLHDSIPYLRADAEMPDISLLHRFGPPGPACRTVPEQRLLGGLPGALPSLVGLNEMERSAITPLYTWVPSSVSRARALAQYNFAVVVAILGNFNGATDCLAAAFSSYSADLSAHL